LSKVPDLLWTNITKTSSWNLIHVMIKSLNLVVYSSALFWMACTADPKQLTGQWQAVAFFEEGQTVGVPLDSVRLMLLPEGRYHFKSLGQYSEAGRWRASVRYLLLTDTTAGAEERERALQVQVVTADTLKLMMKHQGKTQLLFLKNTHS
jgi:hypothetical protein